MFPQDNSELYRADTQDASISVELPVGKFSESFWTVSIVQAGEEVARSEQSRFWFDPFLNWHGKSSLSTP
jgi:hypothetical protein